MGSDVVYASRYSALSGSCVIPTSKSHTIRALFFATLARGVSQIHHPLSSPDTTAMIRACTQFGAQIDVHADRLEVTGVAGAPSTPTDVIDAGNSGQVLRFIACLAGLQPHHVVITGDHSIRTARPVSPLITGLPQLGMRCDSLCENGLAPLILKGPMQAGTVRLVGSDSQPVSGLLMTLPFVAGESVVCVEEAGERPWIDLTLSWLDRLGLPYQRTGYARYIISGGQSIDGFAYTVPGDLSSLAFPLAAALITRSALVIHSVDLADAQGDGAIVDCFKRMGAAIEYDAATHQLTVSTSGQLTGIDIDINDMVDSLPILAVVGCYAQGSMRLSGAAIARQKESNRIEVMVDALKQMGAEITAHADGLTVRASALHGANLSSHADHRVAMALLVAGLGARGTTRVRGAACIDKSFPDFLSVMQRLGAHIQGERSQEAARA